MREKNLEETSSSHASIKTNAISLSHPSSHNNKNCFVTNCSWRRIRQGAALNELIEPARVITQLSGALITNDLLSAPANVIVSTLSSLSRSILPLYCFWCRNTTDLTPLSQVIYTNPKKNERHIRYIFTQLGQHPYHSALAVEILHPLKMLDF